MNTEDIALFHRIVEAGSLVATAEKLELPKSTISRRLNNLESYVGAKLFHRYGRSIKLTVSGAHFYEETKRILTELDQTLIEITDEKAELKGNLKILIAPGPQPQSNHIPIFDFMDMHPSVAIELVSKVESVDLISDHIDVAIMGEHMFTNTDVVAKHLFDEPLRYYASPQYIQSHGEPEDFAGLANHNVAIFQYLNKNHNKRTLLPDGTWQKVKNQLVTNDMNLLMQSVLSSRSISLLPEKTSQQLVDSGELCPLFLGTPPVFIKVFIVFPSRRYISIAAQKFVDFIYEHVNSQQ